jgi:hypothetical protein
VPDGEVIGGRHTGNAGATDDNTCARSCHSTISLSLAAAQAMGRLLAHRSTQPEIHTVGHGRGAPELLAGRLPVHH